MEPLEDRTLLSNYMAASVSDLIADINAASQAGGTNTILLAAKTTFDLTAVNNATNGANGLPVIVKTNHLTITGQGGDIIQRDPSAPAFRLFNVASGGSLTLSFMTLQHGVASGSGSSAEGGAIYNLGSLALNDVTVQNNSAQGSNGTGGKRGADNGQDAAGGGIWSGSALTLTNGTVIQSNQAIGGSGGFDTQGTGGNASGGGIYIAGGSGSLTGTIVNSNAARAGGGGWYFCGLGGCMSLPPGGNGGSAIGGGMAVTGGSITLSDDLLENNSASGGSGGNGQPPGSGGNGSGGGLYAGSSTTVTLCGTTVQSNSAGGGWGLPSGQGAGGAIYGPKAKLYLDSFTSTNTSNNTASVGPNIEGSYTLQPCAMLLVSDFPSPTPAGVPGRFIITLLNSAGATWTNYTGTVHFTSSDSQAALPADYTFTSADNGMHTFTATLTTLGSQLIAVTDKNTATLTGTQWNIKVNPGPVSQLVVAGFPSATAGLTESFSVTAEDAYGNINPAYTGTVKFTSSAAQANLPAAYTFTADDAGVHTFSVSVQTAGTESISATDTARPSITGTQSGIVITPTTSVRLTVATPASVSAGTAFSVTVTAWDAYGNLATNYTGTVTLTSTDGAATLPGPYTFTAADQGVHTFVNGVTLTSSGTQTITATGTAVPAGLSDWWPGEGNANDSVGTNNGTLVGGVTFAPGEVGQAFSLNGVDAYVNFGSAPSFAVQDFTLDAWVSVDPAQNTGERRVLSRDDVPDNLRQMYCLKSSSSAGGDGHARLEILKDGVFTAVTAPSPLAAGFHHLAGTRSGNVLTLYVDGVWVASTVTTITGPISPNAPLVLGQVSPAYNGEFFSGLVDEADLFGRALSPAEIQWIFNAGSEGKHQTITGSTSVPVGTTTPAITSTLGFTPLLSAPSTCARVNAAVTVGRPVGNLVIFGDSLSDTGNTTLGTGGSLPNPDLYYQGRFSNGPIWVDALAQELGEPAVRPSLAGGLDYAFGGATLAYQNQPSPFNGFPRVSQQVGQYLAAHKAAGDDLIVGWGGANDFLESFSSPTGPINPTLPADTLLTSLDALAQRGARQFIVPNLPPLGETPFIRGLGLPGLSTAADEWTAAFDAELGADVGNFKSGHPGTTVVFLNVAGLFQQAAQPSNPFSFINTTDPVGPLVPGSVFLAAVTATDPQDYLFFDGVHPTSRAHKLLGMEAAAAVLEALRVHQLSPVEMLIFSNVMNGQRAPNAGLPVNVGVTASGSSASVALGPGSTGTGKAATRASDTLVQIIPPKSGNQKITAVDQLFAWSAGADLFSVL
jgi:phospholipase/lecithinase/hemolysin